MPPVADFYAQLSKLLAVDMLDGLLTIAWLFLASGFAVGFILGACFCLLFWPRICDFVIAWVDRYRQWSDA